MNTKTQARQRRAKKSRVHMRTAGSVRLSVHRTPRHIYAQVISGDSKTVLAQASTGKLVAERAKAAGVTSVAFDRSGFRYHGRVKALAEAAREGGLEF